MRRGQRAARLNGNLENVDQLNPRVDAAAQGLAVDEFGGNEIYIAADTDFIDGEDVWMVKSGDGARFLDKPLKALLILRDVFWKNLDRDGAIQLRVLGQINVAHAARADLRANFIATQFCART